MAKKPTITSITSGYASTNTLNDNFTALRDAFDNTLSLDGSTPNSMTSDLNLNNNDILNASRILVGGVDYIATALSYKNDAETAKTAAEAAQAAAELAYDNFDDRYLGSKSSDPTVDNDGNALLDGALYYDTINTVMKFYDTSTSTWYRTTPTTSDQANIDIVAGNTTNINTVAGISANVTTVAGISSDVTTVAADGTDIGTVATSISNVNTAATNISNINTVAGISANVTTVAGNTFNINTVATDISNVNIVAGQTTNLQNVTDNLTAIQNAATNATNAATSASNAATSASNASTSETNAASSATSAAASAAAAAASADFFDDVYLGSKASDPATDNDGDALNAGDLYFNTTSNNLKVYSGSAWQDAAVDSSGFVQTTGDTMTGNLDVQGTVTADGLTVQGVSTVEGKSSGFGPNAVFETTGTAKLRLDDLSSTAQNRTFITNNYSRSVSGFTADNSSFGVVNIGLQDGFISFDTAASGNNFPSERMRIDSSGQVGIGTTSPSAALDVLNGSGDGEVAVFSGTDSDRGLSISTFAVSGFGQTGVDLNAQYSSSPTMTLSTGGSEAMRITSSGNVGIGTSSPDSNLHIEGSGSASSEQLLSLVNPLGNVNAGAQLWLSGTNATTRGAYIEGQARSTGNNHDLIFAVSSSGAAPTERMRITSAGNVGIGVTDPVGRLEVKNSGDDNGFEFLPAYSSNINLMNSYNRNTNTYYPLENRASYFMFKNGTSEAMRIDSSGNVGIGTTSPSVNLHMKSSGDTQLWLDSSATSVSNRIVSLGQNGGAYKDLRYDAGQHLFRIGTTERMRIDSSGNVGIGTTSPSSFNSAANNLVVGTGASGDDTGITIYTNSNSSAHLLFADGTSGNASYAGYIRYNHPSDFMAFHNNGGNERMRIDSNGSIGIGTTSPLSNGGVAAKVVHIHNPTVGQWAINHYTNGTSGSGAADGFIVGQIGADASLFLYENATMQFGTNSAEAMRIDNSGNLLVGKTSTSFSTEGVEVRPDTLWVTRDGDTPVFLNRLTSDGTILSFSKDGTTVGSIGARVGDLYLGTGDTGITFADSVDAIRPVNTSTQALRDAAIDIGASSYRFKDLYLSGGVYLGGTGAANKLDDYEEGTWTPSFTYSTSTTGLSIGYSIQLGYYTKIGNIVHFSCDVRVNSFTKGSASGTLQLQGFPFASKNLGNFARPNTVPNLFQWPYTTTAGFQPLFSIFQDGTTKGDLVLMRSNNSSTSLNDPDADSMLFLSGWYYAA